MLCAGVALVAMMLLIATGALSRHLISEPINGSEVIVGVFLAPLVTYFAAASALSARQHVGVTALVGVMPASARRWTQIAAAALTAVLFGMLAWRGWVHAHDALATGQVEPNVGVPLFWAYVTVPVGCVAIALRAVLLTARWWASGDTQISLARRDEAADSRVGEGT